MEVVAGELTLLRTDSRTAADPTKQPPNDARALVGFHVDYTDAVLEAASLRWWRAEPSRVVGNELFVVTVSTIPVAVYAVTELLDSFQWPGELFWRKHFGGTLLAGMHGGGSISYAKSGPADLLALATTVMSSRVFDATSGGPVAYLRPPRMDGDDGGAYFDDDGDDDANDDMEARGLDDDSGFGPDSYAVRANGKDD